MKTVSDYADTNSFRFSGGKVEFVWDKGGVEVMEIQVDRGTGTFAYLATNTRSTYIDTEPFPTPATKWKYRAIYTEDAQRIG